MNLVQRLREHSTSAPPEHPVHPKICDEAADEIERLRNILSTSGEKPNVPAFDELEALLKKRGYQHERIVVVDGDLWCRLANEIISPFGGHIQHPVVWYKNRTMVVPSDSVLLCTKESKE